MSRSVLVVVLALGCSRSSESEKAAALADYQSAVEAVLDLVAAHVDAVDAAESPDEVASLEASFLLEWAGGAE